MGEATKIELTNDVTQDANKDIRDKQSAAGYLVFGADGSSNLFDEFRDAESFAQLQVEEADDMDDTWIVYPLYAADGLTVDFR